MVMWLSVLEGAMSDSNSREEIANVIKRGCRLKAVLSDNKPCPHFGSSGSCDDCSYDWMTMAGEVLKAAKIRRSSYENERKKVKALTERVELLQGTVDTVFSLFGKVGEGFSSISQLVSMARLNMADSDKGKVENDRK